MGTRASDALQEAWAQIDSDGDGSLDSCELQRVLKIVGKSDAQIEQLITSGVFDQDGDDSVSFEEFQRWWQGHILQLLRDWQLLCLTVKVGHLSLLVKKFDTYFQEDSDLIELSITDAAVRENQRLLDRVVDVNLHGGLVIKDCEWEGYNKPRPPRWTSWRDLLRVEETRIRLTKGERDSGLDAVMLNDETWIMPEKVSHALTDVDIGSLAVCVRLELMNDLAGVAACARAAVNWRPPPAALPDVSKMIVKIRFAKVGLVPKSQTHVDERSKNIETVAILKVTNSKAEIEQKADGDTAVDASVQAIRLDQSVESALRQEPAALVMGTDGKKCITVDFTQPSTDVNPSVRIRVNTLHSVVSKEVLHTRCPGMDAGHATCGRTG